MISPIRTRLLVPLGTCFAVALALPTVGGADTYGKLVVRHSAAPAAALQTQFTHVRSPASFVLVVTEPTQMKLQLSWSVRCYDATHHESGGASGRALVTSGHWVKQVRPTWIKHPAYCSGSVAGLAASSPVLVRVFAQ